MAQVFLLQNQHKGLLNKRGEWTDGREARSLFSTLHRDEALNQMIEVNSKDYTLRIKVLECERSDKGVPLLKDEDLPPLGGYVQSPAVAENEASADEVAAETDVAATIAAPQASVESTVAEMGAETVTNTVTEAASEPEAFSPSLSALAGAASAFSTTDASSETLSAGAEPAAEDDAAIAAQIEAMLAAQAQLLADKKQA